ncbi:MAG: hypothetical protein K2X35_19880 [Bryobacteraceae bacterium]|nr:hypothetical protein [Bryobacteraceae bacterium]
MAQATYDDANLVLRLYELRREERMRQARQWMMSEFRAATVDELNKIAPQGSGMDANFRMVVTYWDMAASFITGGILNAELFYQSNRELVIVWEKVRPLIAEIRELRKNPGLWKHLEKVGNEFGDYLKKTEGDEFYETFLKRARAR